VNIPRPFTDVELLTFLDDLESDRTERKESFKGDAPDRVRQAVCAFANDLPNHGKAGVLFIGAKDNGEPSHYPITDELLLKLSDIKTDGNILPLPVLTVEKRLLKGAEMAIITVLPSDMPPVKYQGRMWIRTGPRRSIANAQEERILNEKRRYRDQPWDLHPIAAAAIDDLSRGYFEDEYLPKVFAPDVLKENNRTYEERLASCKMIVSTDDTTPTVLGLLAIGKKPQNYLYGGYIQFVRFNGSKLSDPVIDEEKIDGRFIDMILQTEYKLKAHNRTKVDTSDGPEKLSFDYPHRAFQQILYNAVMHRNYEGTNSPVRVYWYNDRVEITNPGGPYGEVTIENFGKPGKNDYRNPNIAGVFKSLGYVQRYGTGIQIARDEMTRNGNPPLEFDVDTSFVVCKFFAKDTLI
jgi:ATP-dependent DNA helicase RecG